MCMYLAGKTVRRSIASLAPGLVGAAQEVRVEEDTTASRIDKTHRFRNIPKLLLSFTATATTELRILLGDATERRGS